MLKNNLLYILLFVFVFQACEEKKEMSSINEVNWKKRTITKPLKDSIVEGATYLSVYSQVYSLTEHTTYNLTAIVSMRNVNIKDTIYIDRAEYFDTKGSSIRTYFNKTIYIAPMETVEIVIDEKDKEGGTGANFLFTWKTKPNVHEPLFEGVMLSTYGQQGLSFTTNGKRVY
ncbi:DUF3124 domain-containing protein [Siansivirga zeaxanthinifaciens]|uniref:Lipoprotein n=1 Tax=Siansivirga zeaxanthinifaciens CC-SAMT-1 TaxID=1454006 RepID=A0A0C5WG91_9FLAO|nr:DUF3124 domain-containing protein [Siansivirga zeaxanthinifaciens]AJR04194.1 hypothetical protein AW14_11595 [Siansivirga zeaxanthinifaciens CC-SAMT-1]